MNKLCSYNARTARHLTAAVKRIGGRDKTPEAQGFLAKSLRLDPLPILSPCYCGKCKKPLPRMSVVDDQYAWCEDCDAIVRTSWTQVPSWTVGVLVCLLATNWLMR